MGLDVVHRRESRDVSRGETSPATGRQWYTAGNRGMYPGLSLYAAPENEWYTAGNRGMYPGMHGSMRRIVWYTAGNRGMYPGRGGVIISLERYTAGNRGMYPGIPGVNPWSFVVHRRESRDVSRIDYHGDIVAFVVHRRESRDVSRCSSQTEQSQPGGTPPGIAGCIQAPLSDIGGHICGTPPGIAGCIQAAPRNILRQTDFGRRFRKKTGDPMPSHTTISCIVPENPDSVAGQRPPPSRCRRSRPVRSGVPGAEARRPMRPQPLVPGVVRRGL